MNVVDFSSNKKLIADGLRDLAARIDAGEVSASNAIIILDHRETDTVNVKCFGQPMRGSDAIGLLQFAIMMEFQAVTDG